MGSRKLVQKIKKILKEGEWADDETKTVVLGSRRISMDRSIVAQEDIFDYATKSKSIPVYFSHPNALTMNLPGAKVVLPPSEETRFFAFLHCSSVLSKDFASEVLAQSSVILDSTNENTFVKFSISSYIVDHDSTECMIRWGTNEHYQTIYDESTDYQAGIGILYPRDFHVDSESNYVFQCLKTSAMKFLTFMKDIKMENEW